MIQKVIKENGMIAGVITLIEGTPAPIKIQEMFTDAAMNDLKVKGYSLSKDGRILNENMKDALENLPVIESSSLTNDELIEYNMRYAPNASYLFNTWNAYRNVVYNQMAQEYIVQNEAEDLVFWQEEPVEILISTREELVTFLTTGELPSYLTITDIQKWYVKNLPVNAFTKDRALINIKDTDIMYELLNNPKLNTPTKILASYVRKCIPTSFDIIAYRKLGLATHLNIKLTTDNTTELNSLYFRWGVPGTRKEAGIYTENKIVGKPTIRPVIGNTFNPTIIGDSLGTDESIYRNIETPLIAGDSPDAIVRWYAKSNTTAIDVSIKIGVTTFFITGDKIEVRGISESGMKTTQFISRYPDIRSEGTNYPFYVTMSDTVTGETYLRYKPICEDILNVLIHRYTNAKTGGGIINLLKNYGITGMQILKIVAQRFSADSAKEYQKLQSSPISKEEDDANAEVIKSCYSKFNNLSQESFEVIDAKLKEAEDGTLLKEITEAALLHKFALSFSTAELSYESILDIMSDDSFTEESEINLYNVKKTLAKILTGEIGISQVGEEIRKLIWQVKSQIPPQLIGLLQLGIVTVKELYAWAKETTPEFIKDIGNGHKVRITLPSQKALFDKIRREENDAAASLIYNPVYYGTVDAVYTENNATGRAVLFKGRAIISDVTYADKTTVEYKVVNRFRMWVKDHPLLGFSGKPDTPANESIFNEVFNYNYARILKTIVFNRKYKLGGIPSVEFQFKTSIRSFAISGDGKTPVLPTVSIAIDVAHLLSLRNAATVHYNTPIDVLTNNCKYYRDGEAVRITTMYLDATMKPYAVIPYKPVRRYSLPIIPLFQGIVWSNYNNQDLPAEHDISLVDVVNGYNRFNKSYIEASTAQSGISSVYDIIKENVSWFESFNADAKNDATVVSRELPRHPADAYSSIYKDRFLTADEYKDAITYSKSDWSTNINYALKADMIESNKIDPMTLTMKQEQIPNVNLDLHYDIINKSIDTLDSEAKSDEQYISTRRSISVSNLGLIAEDLTEEDINTLFALKVSDKPEILSIQNGMVFLRSGNIIPLEEISSNLKLIKIGKYLVGYNSDAREYIIMEKG